jgi:hypothetical protein
MRWEHHRFFADAPQILSHVEQIREEFDINLRSNGTQLKRLFGGAFPLWPAYESWISSLKSMRRETCTFGPIVPPDAPSDYLAWASLRTLRNIAKAAGLKPKRSKQQTAGVLRDALDSSLLSAAASEGRALWTKYEWAPYALTPFAVLESTISSIECTGKTCALLLGNASFGSLRWITNRGETVCANCAGLSETIASASAVVGQPECVPPLHPGCTCAVTFDLNSLGADGWQLKGLSPPG